ncbi:hypothetical protein V1515DRAFT_597756 [Lipomyces mesembrius]
MKRKLVYPVYSGLCLYYLDGELVKMLGFYGFDIDSEQEDELDMKRKLLAFLGCPGH